MATATTPSAVTPGGVRDAMADLVELLEQVVAARAAVIEQAQLVCDLASKTDFPRLTIAVWEEAKQFSPQYLEENPDWDEGIVEEARSILALIDFATKEAD